MSTLTVEVPVSSTAEETTLTLVVERREDLAAGVVGLTLVSPEGHELPGWEPGGHIDLVLDNGLVRQYSLCGDPGERRSYHVAVLREEQGRGGSRHLHDHLREGQRLQVRGPRNHFELIPAEEYLFIAGGIGVTPIVPMIAAVAASGKPWRLVYGGRSRQSMAFAQSLLTGYGDAVQLLPQDETGPLPLATMLSGVTAGTAVYCCGPEGLLVAVEAECGRQSLTNVRVERFAPKTMPADLPADVFEVEFATSGQSFSVQPDESILDVAERAGIPVDSSCRDGTCGTCEIGVLAGTPDHRDSVLSPAEQAAGQTMFVCVSRCRGPRLVLDL